MSICECKKKTCCQSSEKAHKRHDKCCSKCGQRRSQLKTGLLTISVLSGLVGISLIVAGASTWLAATNTSVQTSPPIVEPQPPVAIDDPPPTAITPGPLPVTGIIEDTPYNSIQVDEALTPKP